MKAELTLPQELVDKIVAKVIEELKPLLDNGKQYEDELLTTEEAALFLKTDKGQIYQWVHNSQHGLCNFPYLKKGKRLLFSKKALLKWLEVR